MEAHNSHPNNKTYFCSSLGRIKNKNRLLSIKPHHSGYVLYQINKVCYSVRILVAKMFLPNEDKTKTIVNHIDENRSNNVISNLEWVTHSINAIHSLGSRANVVKVINYDINKNILGVYASASEAGKKLNVNIRSVNKCCKGELASCGKNKLLFKYVDTGDDLLNLKCGYVPERTRKKTIYKLPRKINVYDRKTGNLLDTVSSVAETAKKYNTTQKQ